MMFSSNCFVKKYFPKITKELHACFFIASSKIACTVSEIRQIDNHKNYTQSQCAQYSTLKNVRTVIVNSSNPAHSARDLRTGNHACLTRTFTGKTNY